MPFGWEFTVESLTPTPTDLGLPQLPFSPGFLEISDQIWGSHHLNFSYSNQLPGGFSQSGQTTGWQLILGTDLILPGNSLDVSGEISLAFDGPHMTGFINHIGFESTLFMIIDNNVAHGSVSSDSEVFGCDRSSSCQFTGEWTTDIAEPSMLLTLAVTLLAVIVINHFKQA